MLEEGREYMERIGWPKVIDHRGISAGRSVEKMSAWMWMLEEDGLVKVCDSGDLYPQYGAPVLAMICQRFSWPIPGTPEVARMIAGDLCEPDCEMGCGK